VAAGETVLLHAASSGVGTAAIQLCAAAGAKVIVTVGSSDKVGS
jgi:NADPH2:quinone reductase